MIVIRFFMVGTGLILLGLAALGFACSGWLLDQSRGRVAARIGEAVGAKVEIKGVGVDPLRQGVVLREVTVCNPGDFKDGNAIACKAVHVELNPFSLFGAAPAVRRILIEDIDVALRWLPGHGTNLGTLARSARKASETQATALQGRAMQVSELACNGGKVGLQGPGGSLTPLALNLSAFNVDGLDKNGPLHGPQMISMFLRSLAKHLVTLEGILGPARDGLIEDSSA